MKLNKITKEISYERLTPVLVYKTIGGVGSCMMESAYDEGYGTYSFIGTNPLASFGVINKEITISQDGKVLRKFVGDPYLELEVFAKDRRVFGFMTYDTVRLKEELPDQHLRRDKLPDMLFHVYKTVIRFDHHDKKVLITHLGSESELEQIIEKMFMHIELSQVEMPNNCIVNPDISDDKFIDMVKKAQEYIKSGDIFQVVLSRTFECNTTVTPFNLYQALRQLSPTPYLTFFEEPDFAIASSSPELLVGIKDGVIESVPIAGTCRKGDDINILLNDEKENAEHVMLVDLARNDVGSVSKPGSVKVAEYKTIKHYSHVSHIVSRVVGALDPKYTPLQVLKASLPAGTLSGAPKIRAMEIVDELENSRRGLYGGALVIIDEDGNLTSAIAIRTAYMEGTKLSLRTGAGIVLDSVAKKEADETRLKALGVIAALDYASGIKI